MVPLTPKMGVSARIGMVDPRCPRGEDAIGQAWTSVVSACGYSS